MSLFCIFASVAFGRTTHYEQHPPSAPVTKQRGYQRPKTHESSAGGVSYLLILVNYLLDIYISFGGWKSLLLFLPSLCMCNLLSDLHTHL